VSSALLARINVVMCARCWARMCVLNRTVADLAVALREACPQGIDVYFENVGGAAQRAVYERELLQAHERLRIAEREQTLLNEPPTTAAVSKPESMPGFGEAFDDRQIADLINFIRSSWGNDTGRVDARTVGAMRRSERR
jgi:hypothetical protein